MRGKMMDCELKHRVLKEKDMDELFKLIQDIQYDRRLKIEEVGVIFGVGITKARQMVVSGVIPKPIVSEGNYVRWSYQEVLEAEKGSRDE